MQITIEPAAPPRDEILGGIDGVCEADGFAQMSLWRELHKRLDWQQEGVGRWYEIGTLDGRPICVAITFNKLNGKRIAFYEAVSQVVDYVVVEAWVEKNLCYRDQPRANAMNFHNVLHPLNITLTKEQP